MGGCDQLFYIGAGKIASFNLLEQCSIWSSKAIMNLVETPSRLIMEEECRKWAQLETVKVQPRDVKSEYDFLFEYVGQLATENGWVDVNSAPMRKKAIMERQSDVATYRDKCFPSLFTKIQSIPPFIPYMKNKDETLEFFTANITTVHRNGK